MPSAIQSREIQGAVAKKTLCTLKTAFNRDWNDERDVNVNRNDNDWNDNWWFAGRRNLLHFSPGFLPGEFCLKSWPLQPPSILPISFSGVETVMYALLWIDFVSHKTMSSIFKVSSFLIASLT